METDAERWAKGFTCWQQFVAMLRYNLFTYRDLWECINKPFEILPIVPDVEQLSLRGI